MREPGEASERDAKGSLISLRVSVPAVSAPCGRASREWTPAAEEDPRRFSSCFVIIQEPTRQCAVFTALRLILKSTRQPNPHNQRPKTTTPLHTPLAGGEGGNADPPRRARLLHRAARSPPRLLDSNPKRCAAFCRGDYPVPCPVPLVAPRGTAPAVRESRVAQRWYGGGDSGRCKEGRAHSALPDYRS